MDYPPLVHHTDEASYRNHFERVYCRGPVTTFDAIQVRFRRDQFFHCFFESSRRDGTKDQFSRVRAERIDWIKAALEDPDSERFLGWDRIRRRYDTKRRVAVVLGNYVVVISMTRKTSAQFITAFLADSTGERGQYSTIEKIHRSPKWA